MPQRPKMDLDAWRAADARGELWMFVDEHWEEAHPQGLTDEEFMRHLEARLIARSGHSALVKR